MSTAGSYPYVTCLCVFSVLAVAELASHADSEDGSPQSEDAPSSRPTADEDTSSRLALRAEDETLLTWPERETVLQIEAADDTHGMIAVGAN